MHAPPCRRAALLSGAAAIAVFGLPALASPAQAAPAAAARGQAARVQAAPVLASPVQAPAPAPAAPAPAAPAPAAPAPAAPVRRVTSGVSDDWARQRLAAAGIDVWSSGDCSDRDDPECTSLEGMRAQTIEWTLVLAEASGCDLLVTGGTEVGHASGTKSHENGYRIDLNASGCLTAHIRRNFTRIAPGLWQSAAGNRYLDEGGHWDVTFG